MAHYTRDVLGSEIPDRADVVIVGAGMAGLYVAWRLKRACQ